MKELIEAYDEYIKLLEQECSNYSVFAFTHGITSSEKDIKRGAELRQKIKELKNKYDL